MTYYDAIVQSITKNLPSGTLWMPELMVIALLSQWILEEEKSTYLYPFLKDIDYLEVLDRFDKAKKASKKDFLYALNQVQSNEPYESDRL
jgi:hypothetical protein